MAASFPLSLAGFVDILPVREMTFDLSEAMDMDETGGGEILTADLGTRLWQGEITLGDLLPEEVAEVMPVLDLLRRAGGSFMVSDRRHPWPRSDPGGAALGAVTPVLHSVAASTREVRLSDLPAFYQLLRHDYLAFAYASGPVRFALHRVASAAAADAGGLTPWIEVSPNIRPGWSAGAAVSLVRAACKAVIVPGSFQPGRRKSLLTAGIGFRFRQTLR